MKVSVWATRVHEHYLACGAVFTADYAVARFGHPQGRSTARRMLNYAAAQGLFQTCDSPGGMVYRAVEPVEQPKPVRAPESWFDGLKRVRSVFELGDSL